MAFTSITFFAFVIISFILIIFVQAIIKKFNVNKYLLLLLSIVYVTWAGIECVLVLLFAAIISYITGLVVSKRKTRLILWISIVLLVGMLSYIKAGISAISVLGISFYTFSSIAYVVDVYKEKIESVKNPLDYLLYLSFFPKFGAGPIVKPEKFFGQVNNARINRLLFEAGIQKIVYGYFKKAVLADRLHLFTNHIFVAPQLFSGWTVLLGIISYSLEIYFDFSGYSDIAIGISKIFGYEFDENFNIPYKAANLTDFWRRWHISLSTWLREYIYIPLGGNRKGIIRMYLNLIITMFIGGLWHGIDYTFIVWGLLHGIGLVLQKLYSKKCKISIPKGLSIILTFIYVSFCWIFFNATTVTSGLKVITSVANIKGIEQPYTWSFVAILVALGEIIYGKEMKLNLSKLSHLTILFTLAGLTLILAYIGNTAFIYNAF